MPFSRPVPRGVGEADDVHARLPHQLRLASVRNYSTTITPGSSNRQDMRLWTVESGFESLPRNCCNGKAPSSRGQGRCPLTAETRVRISVGPYAKSNTAGHLLTAPPSLVSFVCLSCCSNPRIVSKLLTAWRNWRGRLEAIPWDDPQANAMLTQCRRAMTAYSRLLVMECVLPANTPSLGKLVDITMLVHYGALERPEAEYRMRHMMTEPNLVVQAMTGRGPQPAAGSIARTWRARGAMPTSLQGIAKKAASQPLYRLCLRGVQRFSHVCQKSGWCEGFLEKQAVLLGDAIAYDYFWCIARHVNDLHFRAC